MKTELFDFELPEHLIAQVPAQKRSASKLIVHNRFKDTTCHHIFSDIVDYFLPGDLLVVNSSRVIPARIYTIADEHRTGGYEILFVKKLNDNFFEAMVKPGRRFKVGSCHTLPGDKTVEVVEVLPSGLRKLRAIDDSDILPVFREFGEMPLPPYITSRESSPERYQTVYSNQEGSIAAPTAGLHFDNDILAAVKAKGVNISEIILHVGLGTFKPVEVDDLSDHNMHEEVYCISPETAELFHKTRENGGRVWACGTTSVRALESSIDDKGNLGIGWQSTKCFIQPGYKFRAVDCLITNFHLPRSTLIVLISAFCSREKILSLYKEAIEREYRFFSFGDSMILI